MTPTERAREIWESLEDGKGTCDEAGDIAKIAAALAAQAAQTEIANERSAIKSKMLAYIAFVLTGDENADPQLAADRAAAQAAQTRALREALERMLSPELDWENGEVGVGHRLRLIARAALTGAPQERSRH